MLDDLLTIKRRREDTAIAALGAARRELEDRRAAAARAWQDVADHKRSAAAEKERLYDEMQGQAVTRGTLGEYRERVGLLRQRQLALEEDAAAADRAVAAAADEVERARLDRTAANAEVVKFEEYLAAQSREESVRAERKADDEADDAASGRFGRTGRPGGDRGYGSG